MCACVVYLYICAWAACAGTWGVPHCDLPREIAPPAPPHFPFPSPCALATRKASSTAQLAAQARAWAEGGYMQAHLVRARGATGVEAAAGAPFASDACHRSDSIYF